jgi:hypothetical protein
MNRITWVLLFTLLLAIPARADQLAYISKKQAKKARKEIRKMDYVYLYCGCCNSDIKELVKVVKVNIKFTGYENFYEVILIYIDKFGNTVTKGVDLAYVWTNKNNEIRTIGELLKLKHDPCKPLGNVYWN